MQDDFHYYATYCAAFLAGFSHEESLEISYADQFSDLCTATLLKKLKAPVSAATTQHQGELVNQRTDLVGLQEITRIWASFHFLPYDLHAKRERRTKIYMDKYRLICRSNGELVKKTVELAKGKGTPAIGVAMHVLADTWAHANFAGTPSMVINNTDFYFYELLKGENGQERRQITFNNNPTTEDDLEKSHYTNSLQSTNENSIMNLGHGRAGHLPDYGFIRYEYMPAWGDYQVLIKDNPSDYYHAFCQMIQAMLYLRGQLEDFQLNQYAYDLVAPWEDRIHQIIEKRQTNAGEDWKALGQELSGQEIPDFDVTKYQSQYEEAGEEEQDDTFLGQYILAAMSQKSMVTGEIFRSGNLIAGFSVDFNKQGFGGIKDFLKLVKVRKGDKKS